LNATW